MKKTYLKSLKVFIALGVTIVFASSCERDLSDDAIPAPFDQTADIFIDDFIGLGVDFYKPFVPDGAKPDVFSVDDTEGYESNASIRIDVPNADDPAGNFAGAAFVIDGTGRDLTKYDALTFWAKASQAVTIGNLGFGDDFKVGLANADLTTNWTKFVIPIPDPSKLLQVRTVFEFAAGGILPAGATPGTGQEVGYTFWIDELKFENLGTIGQPRPAIMNGVDVVSEAFTGSTGTLTGLIETFNLGNGNDVTLDVSASYYTFSTSNDTVATVDADGNYTVIGDGTVEITAVLANRKALGSLTIESIGDFTFPTPPTQAPANVLSVFSDVYASGVTDFNPVIFNNSSLVANTINIGGDQIVRYDNLSFVGMGWNGSINVSSYNIISMSIQVTDSFDPSMGIQVELADGGNSGGFLIDGSRLSTGNWVTIDIPTTAFTRGTGGGGTGNPNLNNIVSIAFVPQQGGPDLVSSILVDNVYFWR